MSFSVVLFQNSNISTCTIPLSCHIQSFMFECTWTLREFWLAKVTEGLVSSQIRP